MLQKFPALRWLNEPPKYTVDHAANVIVVEAAANTDLYRRPGNIHDTAHCYTAPITGSFTTSVRFQADYTSEYQQAGLILRGGPEEWIKAGVEHYNGAPRVSVVVNRAGGCSDWSVTAYPGPQREPRAPLCIRLQRTEGTVTVETWTDVGGWELVRKTYDWGNGPVEMGIMCAAPGPTGFETTFENLEFKSI
ncbi:hypothetical protein SpCBS45565_g00764 [Spizellomyces sp. 'palustris']|nr:hypothetical protein SpCBS45565_g00764 [Spizellomyces sp. 'palustris']